jgi:hypothetical protein
VGMVIRCGGFWRGCCDWVWGANRRGCSDSMWVWLILCCRVFGGCFEVGLVVVLSCRSGCG